MKRLFTTLLLTIILTCSSLTIAAQNSTCSAPTGPMPQPGDPPICYAGYTIENTGALTQYYTFIAVTPAMQVMLLPVVGTACSFPNTAIFYSNLRLYAEGDCSTLLATGALFFGLVPGDTYIWGCTMTPADPVCVWIAQACPSIVPSPLPIGLSNLEANAINGKVKIDWSVAVPGTWQHFRVQRSYSPDLGFEDAGNLITGTSGQQDFEFLDERPLNENRMFYRLVLIQENGAEEFSEVMDVKSSDSGNWLTVYPNPSQGVSEILISGDQKVSFSVTSMKGAIAHAADEAALKRWMETAPAGIYVVEGSRNNERQAFRWVRM